MIKYIGKQVRESRGYSLRRLAEESTVATSTIWKWENGQAMPDLNVLNIVACTLGCRPWDLIEFENGEVK